MNKLNELTMIVPVLKDKTGLIMDKDNYCPVVITCVASKILELLIREHINDKLYTTSKQYGYSPNMELIYVCSL